MDLAIRRIESVNNTWIQFTNRKKTRKSQIINKTIPQEIDIFNKIVIDNCNEIKRVMDIFNQSPTFAVYVIQALPHCFLGWNIFKHICEYLNPC